MAWGILYKHRGTAGYGILSVFAAAIKRACELLDQGAEVREVSSSDGMKVIGANEIRQICADGARSKPPVMGEPDKGWRP